jgi:hypothetical protein
LGVEEPKLLPAVYSVEGVIDVQDYARGHLPEAGAVQPHHGVGHSQQGAHWASWPAARWAAASKARRRRAAIKGGFEDGIVPQAVGAVAVLAAGRDHQHAKAQVAVRPCRTRSGARGSGAGGEPLGDADPPLDLAQG